MYEYKIIFTREWKNKLVRVGNTLDINENPEEPIDKFVLAIGKKNRWLWWYEPGNFFYISFNFQFVLSIIICIMIVSMWKKYAERLQNDPWAGLVFKIWTRKL